MSNAYYGANVNAFLKIGTSTTTPLPAPGADTFTTVPLVFSLTPPPKELTNAFFSVLNDAVKRAIGGKSNDKVVEGDLVVDWTETLTQGLMCADASIAGGRKRNWQIIYPDTGTRQLDFAGFVSKWTEEPFNAGDDAKEHHAAFTITVDGTVTETP